MPGFVEAAAAAPVPLGPVERKIGASPAGLVRIRPVRGREGDAYARAHPHFEAVRQLEFIVDASARWTSPSAEASSGPLVRCNTTNSSPPTRASRSEAPRQVRMRSVTDFEQGVTDRVAETVVDSLEPVEVDAHQGQRGVRRELVEPFGHGLAEQDPVRGPGQRIVRRHVADLGGADRDLPLQPALGSRGQLGIAAQQRHDAEAGRQQPGDHRIAADLEQARRFRLGAVVEVAVRPSDPDRPVAVEVGQRQVDPVRIDELGVGQASHHRLGRKPVLAGRRSGATRSHSPG